MKMRNKSLKPVVALLRSRQAQWTLEPGAAKELSDALIALDHALAIKDSLKAKKAANRLARTFFRNAR